MLANSWLLKKPTDLDLHCLQRQVISGFSMARVKGFTCFYWLKNAQSAAEHLGFIGKKLIAGCSKGKSGKLNMILLICI